jgi:hypothetical protein
MSVGLAGSSAVSGVGAADKDECKPLNGENDATKTVATLLWQIAAAAAVAAQAAASAYISAKQFEIAKMMLSIAKYWRDWYNSAYVPLEDKEVSELYALKDYEPHYDVAMGRGRSTVRFVMKGVTAKTMRCTFAYDTGLRERIFHESLRAEAEAVSYGAAAGYRMERDKTDKLNESLWQRFLGAVSRGREIAATSVSYGTLAANVYGSLGKTAAAGLSGFTKLFGYVSAREPVKYNQGRGAYAGYSQVTRFYDLLNGEK